MKSFFEEHPILLWRLLRVIVLLTWIIVIWSYLFVLGIGDTPGDLLTLPTFIVIASLSLPALMYLIAFPLKFPIDALLYYLWGVTGLIEGDCLISLALCLLGCAFAFKAGFFHTHRKAKVAVIALVVLMAMGSQCRYDAEIIVKNLMHCLVLFVIMGLAACLFLPEIRKKVLAKQKSAVHKLSPASFTREDIVILGKILDGEKYDSIASSYGKSDSAFKKHLKILFQRLGVDDRVSFMSRYAGCVFILEENVQPPATDGLR
jgi:hypothetical protein